MKFAGIDGCRAGWCVVSLAKDDSWKIGIVGTKTLPESGLQPDSADCPNYPQPTLPDCPMQIVYSDTEKD